MGLEELLGEFADTQSRWSTLVDGARVYEPERHAMHETWLTAAFTGRSVRRGEPPTALVLAGGPASGKSTLLDRLPVDLAWMRAQERFERSGRFVSCTPRCRGGTWR